MQEQNFEKQVREKMDELSFVPSAPVWEKVEEQIRKKKEKRRIIFWLLPLFIVTGLSWWLLVEEGFIHLKKTDQASTQKEVNQQSEAIRVNKTPLSERPASNEQSIEKQQQTLRSDETKQTHLVTNHFKSRASTYPQQKPAIIPSSTGEPLSEQIKNSDQAFTETVSLPVFTTIVQGFNADSIFNSKSLIIQEIPDLENDQKKEVQPTVQNKWQLAFAVQGGISGISDGFGSLGRSAEILYDAASTPNTSAGGNIGNLPLTPPSTPQANFAFSAGIDVKRKINSRIAVISGLRYAYYSNSLQVGSMVHRDTSIARQNASFLQTEAFYRNDANKQKYTNQYHFIQVPLSMEYKLLAHLPLYMQAGIKIEQLIGSNALFYNRYAGVYVKDKEMLVQTGLHLFSGFSYHIRSKKAFSFAIGPQIQYGVTNLSKNKSNDQHLYFVGISTQFFLKKK
jgi:hypothetical protein